MSKNNDNRPELLQILDEMVATLTAEAEIARVAPELDGIAIKRLQAELATLTARAEAAEAEVVALRKCVFIGMDLTNHHNAALCPYCTPEAMSKAVPFIASLRAELAELKARQPDVRRKERERCESAIEPIADNCETEEAQIAVMTCVAAIRAMGDGE